MAQKTFLPQMSGPRNLQGNCIPLFRMKTNMQKAHGSIVVSMQPEDNKQIAHNENQNQIRLENKRLMLDSLDLLLRKSHLSIGRGMARIESTITRSGKIDLLLIAGTLFTAVTTALIIARTIIGVQVAIKDSGIGINPEELPSVFDRFYQASNIEKIGSNGSGVDI